MPLESTLPPADVERAQSSSPPGGTSISRVERPLIGAEGNHQQAEVCSPANVPGGTSPALVHQASAGGGAGTEMSLKELYDYTLNQCVDPGFAPANDTLDAIGRLFAQLEPKQVEAIVRALAPKVMGLACGGQLKVFRVMGVGARLASIDKAEATTLLLAKHPEMHISAASLAVHKGHTDAITELAEGLRECGITGRRAFDAFKLMDISGKPVLTCRVGVSGDVGFFSTFAQATRIVDIAVDDAVGLLTTLEGGISPLGLAVHKLKSGAFVAFAMALRELEVTDAALLDHEAYQGWQDATALSHARTRGYPDVDREYADAVKVLDPQNAEWRNALAR